MAAHGRRGKPNPAADPAWALGASRLQLGFFEQSGRRAEMRLLGWQLDGALLATSLTAYSERGEAYVRDVQVIIRANDLPPLDRARLDGEGVTHIVAASP